jgi:hypothetical protein
MEWTDDGILFAQAGQGILRVPSAGGEPKVIVPVPPSETAQSPQILPDKDSVLFAVATGGSFDRWERGKIVVHSIRSGQRTIVIEGGSDARYLPSGHLVYALGGRLFAVAFDASGKETTGDPVAVVEGVRRVSNLIGGSTGGTGAAQYAVSENGTLVYLAGPLTATIGDSDLGLIDGDGVVQPLKLPVGPYASPRVSPDGRQVAFVRDDGTNADVWIHDLSGISLLRPLTFGGHSRHPIWSSDSKRVTFQSSRSGDLGIYWQGSDGTTEAERLTTAATGESHEPESWSPDSRHLLFSITKGQEVSLHVFTLPEKTISEIGGVTSTGDRLGAVFSPDGRWIAYARREEIERRATVYIQPFPATNARYQLFAKSNDDPHGPVWSPDGRRLYYVARPGGFESVAVQTKPGVAFGNPVLIASPFALMATTVRRSYDITPNGKFVGLVSPTGDAAPGASALNQPIQVTLNWFDELKQRVPVK